MADKDVLSDLKIAYEEAYACSLSAAGMESLESAIRKLDTTALEFYKITNSWPTETDSKKISYVKGQLDDTLRLRDHYAETLTRVEVGSNDHKYYCAAQAGVIAQVDFWEQELRDTIKGLQAKKPKRSSPAKKKPKKSLDKQVADLISLPES